MPVNTSWPPLSYRSATRREPHFFKCWAPFSLSLLLVIMKWSVPWWTWWAPLPVHLLYFLCFGPSAFFFGRLSAWPKWSPKIQPSLFWEVHWLVASPLPLQIRFGSMRSKLKSTPWQPSSWPFYFIWGFAGRLTWTSPEAIAGSFWSHSSSVSRSVFILWVC